MVRPLLVLSREVEGVVLVEEEVVEAFLGLISGARVKGSVNGLLVTFVFKRNILV